MLEQAQENGGYLVDFIKKEEKLKKKVIGQQIT
jgi:hypothetical protein